jgi:hypothetical protein
MTAPMMTMPPMTMLMLMALTPMLTPMPINDDVTDADGAYEINDAHDDHDS